ncbi:hypothetical protein CLOM621_07909 [Clostridium sp. M62/1]|nr:hypothetical protein CLOM621_07909 [Clostridium sp. M62/1]
MLFLPYAVSFSCRSFSLRRGCIWNFSTEGRKRSSSQQSLQEGSPGARKKSVQRGMIFLQNVV